MCIRDSTTTVRESLNDQIGNRGIYDEDVLTQDLSLEPTDDLMVYKVSPGKAYVKGYEVETLRAENIDVQKPRTTKTLENQSQILHLVLHFNWIMLLDHLL